MGVVVSKRDVLPRTKVNLGIHELQYIDNHHSFLTTCFLTLGSFKFKHSLNENDVHRLVSLGKACLEAFLVLVAVSNHLVVPVCFKINWTVSLCEDFMSTASINLKFVSTFVVKKNEVEKLASHC